MADFLKVLFQLSPLAVLIIIGLLLIASLGFEEYFGLKPRKEARKFMVTSGVFIIIIALGLALGPAELRRALVRGEAESGSVVKGEPKTAIQPADIPVTAKTNSLAAPEVSTSPATVVDNKTCATDDPPITCLFRSP